MSTDTVPWTVHRARIARAAQTGADASQARRELDEAKFEKQFEKHLADLVASAPRLSEEQRARLAALLRPVVDGGDRP